MNEFEKNNHPLIESHAKKATTYEPAPKSGETTIYPLVIIDIAARAEMGNRKYGTYLQTENGRDGLNDAYQEVLDLIVYLRQEIEEQNVLFNLLAVDNMTEAIDRVRILLGHKQADEENTDAG